jgi:glutathione synthase/RimK-type ligase-like ATP-grasp enzyme
MPRVLLLTALPSPPADDNAVLLAAALRDRGRDVRIACMDDLHLGADGVAVSTTAGSLPLAACDLVWVLGFGRRETFLDKMQLLATAPTRFVNSVTALLSLHGKYPFPEASDRFPQPPTFAHRDPEVLLEQARSMGGSWVIKPPGGSFGRDVHRVHSDDVRLPGLLRAGTADGRYLLLQRYCPEAETREHRVLVAGGRVIGAYRRRHGEATGGAANLARGGVAEAALEDPERDAIALRAAGWLQERGVAFAGLDLAGPWVLEANIVNPGGLATLISLGGGDRAPAVVDAILAAGPDPA